MNGPWVLTDFVPRKIRGVARFSGQYSKHPGPTRFLCNLGTIIPRIEGLPVHTPEDGARLLEAPNAQNS